MTRSSLPWSTRRSAKPFETRNGTQDKRRRVLLSRLDRRLTRRRRLDPGLRPLRYRLRWLDKQPLAETLEQLQRQVDAFDVIYNTERPHQGLPCRITPALAWAATPVVEPPRPVPQPAAPVGHDGLRMTRIHDNGTVYARGAKFQVSRTLAGQIAYRVEEDDRLLIFDARGTLLTEYPWPAPGIRYVGSGNPRGPRGPRKTR